MSKLNDASISWLIIGQQTPIKASTMPRIEWISEIVAAADKSGCKVFLKDNLEPLINSAILWPWAYDGKGNLRQEFPAHRPGGETGK